MRDERLARAALTVTTEPADAAVVAAVQQFGARAVVEDHPRARRKVEEADVLLTRHEEAGGRFLIPGDPEWPGQLDDLGDECPHGLWVTGEGDLRMLSLRSVSIVGARACTDYGTRVAGLLGSGLAERGWCVVSGGAFGIDASAHRGALATGCTVAVLACGPDVAYPEAHSALFERCREAGLVVTEAPPGEPARRWRFLDRNRLIAALTRGTVVVEAAHRSGALSTARRAADLGRQVMAVPGPVTSGASAGTHALLRTGAATLVTCVEDVLEQIGGAVAPREAADVLAMLPGEAAGVLAVLAPRRASTATDIGTRVGMDEATALSLLAALELGGLARRTTRGWVCSVGA